jgi:hypothetical protein
VVIFFFVALHILLYVGFFFFFFVCVCVCVCVCVFCDLMLVCC